MNKSFVVIQGIVEYTSVRWIAKVLLTLSLKWQADRSVKNMRFCITRLLDGIDIELGSVCPR